MKTDEKRFMVFDYETFSEHPLKGAGAWEYSMHPSTSILCVGFCIGTKEELETAPVNLWVPEAPNESTKDAFRLFLRSLRDPDVTLVVHNAMFEMSITSNVFARDFMPSMPSLARIPPERYICTAATARYHGHPGNLSGACKSAGLKNLKDDEGKKSMIKLSVPRKPTKGNPFNFCDRETFADEYRTLHEYCKQDVRAQTELFLKLDPLPEIERRFWLLDQKMNLMGFAVDRELVLAAIPQIERETARLDAMVPKLSNGEMDSARQVAKLKAVLKREGCDMETLQASAIQERIKEPGLTPRAKALLEIRQAVSRSSNSKYESFDIATRTDGRARDTLLYYGAHTGRQTGRGVQPQNLFKSVLPQSDVLAGIEMIKRCDTRGIAKRFKRPLELYSSCLRSCIVAGPGKVLEVGDFAKIEVCVLFWVAAHEKGLDALRSGRDLYSEMASVIYGVPVDRVTPKMRQLGKQVVLGAGFGIGVTGTKFQETAKGYGIDIDLEMASKAVRSYRALHAPVPRFWSVIEHAATQAVRLRGKRIKHHGLLWQMEGSALSATLPSGRKIFYPYAKIKLTPTLYGNKPALEFLGVDALSGKQVRTTTWGGKLTENVVQGIARDLLFEAVDRIERHPARSVVLTVHDEIVCERVDGESKLTEFERLMGIVPKWAEGLPVAIEAWEGQRYRK